MYFNNVDCVIVTFQ